jgi:myo-inositol-1(or 4)-monophosphatase
MMGFGDICLDVAVHAAREAGSIHKSFIRNGFDTTSKEDPHNKVTEADIQSERRIKEIIRSTFPDHGCIGEEEGTEKHIETEYTWIIDPLDGTNNFY